MSRFRPEWAPTLLLLAVLGVTLNLGRWQLRRDAERNELRDTMQSRATAPEVGEAELLGPAEALYGRRARLAGRFEAPLLLEEGRPGPGGPGYGAFQAFRAGGAAVLVDRGWVAGPEATFPPADTVEGLLVPLSAGEAAGAQGRFPPGSGRAMRAAVPGAIDAVLVEGAAAGLPARDDTSLSYAIQWFLIATIAMGTWIWWTIRRSAAPR